MKAILAVLIGSMLSLGWEARGALPEPGSATASATPAPPPSAPAQRSAAELEKLAAPIALHPDPLIAILLPASVYPVEIVQAARFVKDTNNIPKVDEQSWDESVKAVAKFPQLIAQMDADFNWTISLGQAFLDQPKDLMDTIQALRAKAQKAGTLQTSSQQVVVVTNTVVEKVIEQQVVVVTNTVVQIQPTNPQVVYVPTYPPTVYYPPPTYVYDPWAPLITFGAGVAVGAIIANNWNHCDWHGGCVYRGDVDININNVNINRNTNINRDRAGSTGARPSQQKWQPDQNRLRTSGAAPPAQTREARGWAGSGSASRPSTGTGVSAGARPSTGAAGARPTTGAVGARPSGGNVAARPSTGAGTYNRPTPAANVPGGASSFQRSAPSVNRPSPSGGSAFGGVNSGASARNYSSRGSSSMGGGGRAGGGFSGGGARGGGRR